MTLFKGKFRVESARLPGYDYASPGAYFVTICTQGRRHWFGEVKNGFMSLNGAGNLIWQEWYKTGQILSHLVLDAFIVMPNHVHGILIIRDSNHDRAVVPPKPGSQFGKTVETPFMGVSSNLRRETM